MRAVLRRIDAGRNMARYYALDVQPTLFGEWAMVREWGRIGQCGQQRVAVYGTEGEATAALDRQRLRKEHRGYRPCNGAGAADQVSASVSGEGPAAREGGPPPVGGGGTLRRTTGAER